MLLTAEILQDEVDWKDVTMSVNANASPSASKLFTATIGVRYHAALHLWSKVLVFA